MTKALTVANLPINTKERLTDSVKKELQKIIDTAFRNKENQFSYELNSQRDKILSDYKKRIKFSELLKKMNAAQAMYDQAKRDLESTGLNTDGEVGGYSRHYKGKNLAAIQLDKNLDNLSNSINPIKELHDKMSARLWMATTVGEATVIVHEIMGNSQIPTLTESHMLEVNNGTN